MIFRTAGERLRSPGIDSTVVTPLPPEPGRGGAARRGDGGGRARGACTARGCRDVAAHAASRGRWPRAPRRRRLRRAPPSVPISVPTSTVVPSCTRIDSQRALRGRRDLDVDLVGLDLDQRLFLAHARRPPPSATWKRCPRRRSRRAGAPRSRSASKPPVHWPHEPASSGRGRGAAPRLPIATRRGRVRTFSLASRCLAPLQPQPASLQRPRVLGALFVGLEHQRRHRRRPPRDRVERHERHERGAGVPPLAGQQVLGVDLDADLHAAVIHQRDARVDQRELADLDRARGTTSRRSPRSPPGRRQWRFATTAAARSIQCITVPPSTVPCTLASCGSTSWVISVAESRTRWPGAWSRWSRSTGQYRQG